MADKKLPRIRNTPLLPEFKDIKDESTKRYAENINRFLQDFSGKLYKDLYDIIGQGFSMVIEDGAVILYLGIPGAEDSWQIIVNGHNMDFNHCESLTYVKRGGWTGK